MVVVERNPVPFTVSVSFPEPATTVVGLIEVTVGADGVVAPVPTKTLLRLPRSR